jgi:hypothetical protein
MVKQEEFENCQSWTMRRRSWSKGGKVWWRPRKNNDLLEWLGVEVDSTCYKGFVFEHPCASIDASLFPA